MAASAVAERTDLVVTRRPRASLRWAIAAVGCAAAGAVFVISYGLDEPAPEVDAVLVTWITLSYVFCGLIAWSRRTKQHHVGARAPTRPAERSSAGFVLTLDS